jgi:hypothetical protein
MNNIKLNNTYHFWWKCYLIDTLQSDTTGIIIINISGKIIDGDTINGTETITTPDLSWGTYILEITYNDGKKYSNILYMVVLLF